MTTENEFTGRFEAHSEVTAGEDQSSGSRKRFKRHVYHLPGYDTADCEAHYRRFVGQLGQFKRTWSVQATLSEVERSNLQSRGWWTVKTHSADWQVETVHEVLLWNVLTPASYAHNRSRYMRLHYQPVMANEKRAPYDYFMMACGPALFRNWTVSPMGLLDFMRADGSFREPSIRGCALVTGSSC